VTNDKENAEYGEQNLKEFGNDKLIDAAAIEEASKTH
jgi:hypothetical protein